MSPFPRAIRPMLATPGEAFDSDAHTFELKWDGIRALAYKDGSEFWLTTRNLKPALPRFPELRRLQDHIEADQAILDGEIVILGPDGRPNFDRVRARNAQRDPQAIARSQQVSPTVYVAFDSLYHNGEDLMARPLHTRQERLHAIVCEGDSISLPKGIRGQGTALFQAAADQGLEGIVAKALESPYEPGRRSRDWIKVRNVYTADCVIGGFEPKEGGYFKSLLLGLYETDGSLRFVGHVGTGFSDAENSSLRAGLDRINQEEPAFSSIPGAYARSARWTQPTLVCTVEFLTLTANGHLRHPAFRGLRPDKRASECRIESEFGPFLVSSV